MKLIDEEKVKVASENYSCNRSSETGQIDFKAGVEFAENELKNLSIEFAEWLAIYYDYGHSEEYWFGHDGKYTSAELFKKFMEQRTK